MDDTQEDTDTSLEIGTKITHRHGERPRGKCTTQETHIQTHGETRVPTDTRRESRTHVHLGAHTHTHQETARRCQRDRGQTDRWTDLSQQICACVCPLRGHNCHLSTPDLRELWPPPRAAPQNYHQLCEHTCGGPALLTHECMSRQACAPPLEADIPVLGCRWGPWDIPLLYRPQAVLTGRDRGPGLAQEQGGPGGGGGCRGAAGAGSGAYTCQTRAKEQTSFLVTLLFSPFWQRPLGARGS